MKLKVGTMLAVGLLAATFCHAQGGPMGGGMGGPGGGGPMGGQMGGGGPGEQRDSFMQDFFPAEMVMKFQQELALSEEQKTVLKATMQEQAGEFSTLQWEQTEAKDALAALLQTAVIDQAQATEQLDKLLAVEGRMKKLQFVGMIKIRNVLTVDQIAILKEKKKSMRPMGMGGGRGQMQKPMAPPPEIEAAPAPSTEPVVTEPASTPAPTEE